MGKLGREEVAVCYGGYKRRIPGGSKFYPDYKTGVGPRGRATRSTRDATPHAVGLEYGGYGTAVRISTSGRRTMYPCYKTGRGVLSDSTITIRGVGDGACGRVRCTHVRGRRGRGIGGRGRRRGGTCDGDFLDGFAVVVVFVYLVYAFATFNSGRVLTKVVTLVRAIVFTMS